MSVPGAHQLPASSLAVVATPLGHLGDITARQKDALEQADWVLAEDTRRTRTLLAHLGLSRPLASLHAHNEFEACDLWVKRLSEGARLAIVSDAGTPAISDPGALLVAAAHEHGFIVCPIPGPSALAVALSAAGFLVGHEGAWFVGFLPRKGQERARMLERIHAFAGISVCFESPHRMATTLNDLAKSDGARLACMCRELTKRHEEIVRAPLLDLAHAVREKGGRGEYTLVVGPRTPPADTPPDFSSAKERDLSVLAHRLLEKGLSGRDTSSALEICFGLGHKEAHRLSNLAKKA